MSRSQPVQEQGRPSFHPEWRTRLSEFQHPSTYKALWQLANTVAPYVALWILMASMLRHGVAYGWVLPPIVLASGLLLRIFVLFHDCTHDSFFLSRRANRIVGCITGVLTFTPFDEWKHKHALHHAGSGNLERRGAGDVWTMTVEEYLTAPFWTRVGYRCYRNPLILLVLGPPYLFLVLNRLPAAVTGARGRRSVFITNLALLCTGLALSLVMGWRTYLLIQIPVMTLASVCGVWLFYVQHQYEQPYWAHQEEWDPFRAAMEGSSYYKLPKVLQWFSGNIGLHHIHHLRARIPNYNLQACYDSIPSLQCVQPLTLWRSLPCIFLTLWDEQKRTLVTFRAARRRQRNPGGILP